EPTATRAARNREHFATVIGRCQGRLDWVAPSGGTVAFPWLTGVPDTRPFCEALASRGVLVAPGDCFGAPRHFRLGLGACEAFEPACELLVSAVLALAA